MRVENALNSNPDNDYPDKMKSWNKGLLKSFEKEPNFSINLLMVPKENCFNKTTIKSKKGVYRSISPVPKTPKSFCEDGGGLADANFQRLRGMRMQIQSVKRK